MAIWTDGYVADIEYTFGYYAELNPIRATMPLLVSGLLPPKFKNACELGFGQGMSVNLHAAGNAKTTWFGTDFNPTQARFAQNLAEKSGAKTDLSDAAFADFCARDDLPDFDFIGLHGIWSWISDENRQVIVDFIHKKLMVGGVLYISYNTMPGWASFAPVRHIMAQHAEKTSGPAQGMVKRVDDAVSFVDELLSAGSNFVRANPQVSSRFEKIKEQNRNYLAHEYFNRDWHPMYFADMTQWLEPAKLSFACSANFLDQVDIINHNPEQQKLLDAIDDPNFKQTIRDYIINQQFRKDYWVKGPLPLDKLKQAELIRAHRIILISNRESVVLKTAGALGEVTLHETVYAPILDALANHQVMSIGELESLVRDKGVNSSQLIQALMILLGNQHIQSVQDQENIEASMDACQRINDEIALGSRSANDINFLVSPLTGGGVAVPRFAQLFLLAIKRGKTKPNELAEFVWEILSLQNQVLIKDGKPLSTPEENLIDLTSQAQEFIDKQLPILKSLLIVRYDWAG